MHSVVPDAKLIYVVRDPLLRIASHWVHNYAKRREKGDLATTLAHPNTSYMLRSQYYMQLQQFLRFYERDQILVLPAERLPPGPRRTALREVFEFLGVDPDFSHPSFERERHATARKTRATRLAARLERMSKTPARARWCRRRSGSRSTSACRCAARSSVPTCARRSMTRRCACCGRTPSACAS